MFQETSRQIDAREIVEVNKGAFFVDKSKFQSSGYGDVVDNTVQCKFNRHLRLVCGKKVV
ncbi:MAG TPA: hypothetical protein VLE02_01510 [Nitrosarchaeum sp.]|nr:hypothetical protein [Nitrosarchaeum sp.]